MIILGEGGRFMHGGFGGAGEGEAASVLSFGGTIAGFALGWTSLAADYTVNFPVETADWKVFACTYAGLNFPLIFVECLGALMMSTFVDKPTWGARYDEGRLGGLLRAGLSPLGGFGQFLLVVLALSIVTNVSASLALVCGGVSGSRRRLWPRAKDPNLPSARSRTLTSLYRYRTSRTCTRSRLRCRASTSRSSAFRVSRSASCARSSVRHPPPSLLSPKSAIGN